MTSIRISAAAPVANTDQPNGALEIVCGSDMKGTAHCCGTMPTADVYGLNGTQTCRQPDSTGHFIHSARVVSLLPPILREPAGLHPKTGLRPAFVAGMQHGFVEYGKTVYDCFAVRGDRN